MILMKCLRRTAVHKADTQANLSNKSKELFYKELIQLAVPLALQNLLNALVGASDALMLARLNQQAIAAVSLANQVSFLMSLVTGAITTAIAVLIAQYWGKEDYNKAKEFLTMSIRYVCMVSICFFMLAFFYPHRLMALFTNEIDLINIGSQYLKIVSFSFVFSSIAQCYLALIRISGNAQMSVYISLSTVIVDMIIDLFLIYGIGFFPKLGANGAAYSTICVEIIAMIWCILWSNKHANTKLSIHSLGYFSSANERAIWQIIPGTLFSALAWGLSITMQSFIMGHLGTDATAAYSINALTQQLIQCITSGISSAASIMIGLYLGKNLLDKAKEYGNYFWTVSAISGSINVVLILAMGALVYTFYKLEPLAKAYLIRMLLFSTIYMFAYAYNTIIVVGVFPAGGDTKYDAISVIIATWCIALPLALIGCFVLNLNVIVVYICMCLDEIIKAPFIRRRYNKYLWLKNLTRTA